MSPPIRMLMVSPAAPWPATTGGLVRIAGILRQMTRHFDVTLVCARRPEQACPAGPTLRSACPAIGDPGLLRRGMAALDPSRPFHAALYARPQIARVARRELATGGYDVVYSHFIYGVQYFRDARVPVIVDQQNVDRVYWHNKAVHSSFPLSLYAAWNTRRTIAYESRMLSSIWAYVSVSGEDRDQTRAYAAPQVKHFWVAANGVDTGRFTPGPDRTPSDEVTLGYLGSMDLQMNTEAVHRFGEQLLPQIRQAAPEIDFRFVVIGREPADSLKKLAASVPGVSLSGTVDDVVPWLQKVDVLVSPLRIGAGTKLKVAEAMACGLPVVGSALAFAGMPGRSGEHFVLAESEARFVAAVCRLSRDPAERARLGRNARELATRSLDWDAIGDRLAGDIRGGLAEHRRIP